MNTKQYAKSSSEAFKFWPVIGKSLLWSIPVALVGGLLFGVLGLYGMCENIPLVGSLSNSSRVVGISGTLAVLATFGAATAFFEEAGVLLGFIILSFFGILVLVACVWFGANAFNFIRCAIAGGMLTPAIGFPVTFALVAKQN